VKHCLDKEVAKGRKSIENEVFAFRYGYFKIGLLI